VDVLSAFRDNQIALVAPDHIRYEVASALRVATRTNPPRITDGQAKRAILDFLSLELQTVSDNALIMAGYAAAGEYGCAFYDGLYVALAERSNLPLLTSDHKLYQRIRHLPQVLWLGHWSPSR